MKNIMELRAGIKESIRTLNIAELLIRRELSLVDASPFIAHCKLTEADRSRFATAFREFLAGDGDRIAEGFRRWPLASVWNFAIALSEEYGEDGHAVYAVLEKTFDVQFVGEVRNKVIRAFRSVCRKFGLCYEGSARFVNDYLAQAGVATAQLGHVARAFLFAERAYGTPFNDNTAALNSWEDDAVHFLPPGVRVPRMVLEVDDSAHYALLFVRYRRQEEPRNPFEKHFYEEITEAQKSIAGGRHGEAIPRPALIWGQNGLALSLPKMEGRLTLSFGGDVRKIRGGQNWLLPTPWPNSIDWSLEDHAERLAIFQAEDHLIAFDSETGRFVGSLDPAEPGKRSLDAREVALVARHSFSLNGEPAFEVGSRGFAVYGSLGAGSATIKIGDRAFEIRSKPKPRIWLDTGLVARGPKGPLILPASRLGIEVGGLDDQNLDLALSIGDHQEIIALSISPSERTATYQLFEPGARTTNLVPVRADLRLRDSNRAIVRYRAWLWPGLKSLNDGLVFESAAVPENYSPDRTRHISKDAFGHLSLETDSAYEKATLAFQVGHEFVEFEIPRPGTSLLFTDVEGRTAPLRIGETLIVRDEDKGGSLIIRCAEPSAKLDVRGRLIPDAFKKSPTRTLSLAELSTPAPRDDVTLSLPSVSYAPLTLARIVPASAPKQFSVERRGGTLSLRIEMQTEIDAIRLVMEDENGAQSECDCAVGHREVDGRTPPWLKASLDFENARRVIAVIDLRQFPGEMTLASMFVRYPRTESFRPLRKTRGDSYALVFDAAGATNDSPASSESSLRRRFETLNRWMNECFSQESWDDVGPRIQRRWMSLGAEVCTLAAGQEILLRGGHLPPQPGAARSWVPLAHPLQITAALYGAPASSFFALSGDVAEGAEHLAVLAETARRSIQEVHKAIGLSLAFLMAFDNFKEARQSFEKSRSAHQIPKALRGFNFEKYGQLFQAMDTNPGARWFWRPGDELLGPAHYGAAMGRLIDRLYDAGLEEDGSNDGRIRAATSLARTASMRREKTLPVPAGIEDGHALVEWLPAFFSGFARASRLGSAEVYLKEISVETDRPYRSLISDASFLIRLAPELFAFYLTLWELSSARQAA